MEQQIKHKAPEPASIPIIDIQLLDELINESNLSEEEDEITSIGNVLSCSCRRACANPRMENTGVEIIDCQSDSDHESDEEH
jgi:hypothetical protein